MNFESGKYVTYQLMLNSWTNMNFDFSLCRIISFRYIKKKTLSLNYAPAINLNVLDILIVKSKDEKYFSDLR